MLARDGHRCVCCGRAACGPDSIGYSRHHRLPRGSGGTRDPQSNGLANRVLLCGSATDGRGCHHLAEQHRRWAITCGYLRARGRGTPPADRAPVWWHGRWVLLDDAGNVADITDQPPAPPPRPPPPAR